MRYLTAILAATFLTAPAQARPVVWGGTPCTQDGADTDGCYNGGSIQFPDFFNGRAEQSVGARVNAGSNPYVTWTAATSLQPTTYTTRPPWNVAGVDYAVGMPRWQQPNLSNLSGQPWLKDPANVANDPLANPDGPGADCIWVASNAAVTGGVMPGTSASPYPFPNGGPGIFCSRATGSTSPIVFNGYNFGWNSSTGYGCVPVYLRPYSWGATAANSSATTANIQFGGNLFVNGPQCAVWGEVGGASPGPNQAQRTWMIFVAAGTGVYNSIGFYNNTVYGCGGDSLATALETALCSASFNSTSYAAGSVGGFVAGTVGVSPVQNFEIYEGGYSSIWDVNNAFLHMTSHFADPGNANILPGNQYHIGNYIEGMGYISPYQYAFQVASIANSGGTTETITTVAPHGMPIGSYFAMTIGSGGASGFPTGWSGSWSLQSTGTNTLTFSSATNFGNYTYSGSGGYASGLPVSEHGEFQATAYSTAGAVFNGTISGTGLTVNTLTSGTLSVGQYVTAATGSGLSIPSPTYIVSGSGSNWVLNQAPGNMTGNMVSPNFSVGAQGYRVTMQIAYNTVLSTRSMTGNANTGFFYLSAGNGTLGIPLLQITGSADHNVLVTNLTNSPGNRGNSSLIETAYDSLGSFAFTKNYLDPSGAYFCWVELETDPSTAPTFSGNVNLLSPGDPYVNQWSTYSIVPYSPGTASNSQAENGMSYNSTTGVVTVTLSDSALPPGFGVGSTFNLGNASVSGGTNYLNGIHTVTGVSGNTFTFSVATGFAGTPNAVSATISPLTSGGASKNCYGHN